MILRSRPPLAALAVLALAATSPLRAQDAPAPLALARETADSTLQQPASFSFQLGGTAFTVAADGAVRRAADSASLRLPMPQGGRIERLYAGPLGGDLLVVYEATDGEDGWTTAARLDPGSFAPRWTQKIPTFNTAPPLVAAREMYVAGLDFLGRLDPETGDWVWQKNTLTPRGARAFQAFGGIAVDGERVVFTEDVRGRAGRVIRASRADGAIVEIR